MNQHQLMQHYNQYNYAAAQQYSHLMAATGHGFPMNVYHAAAQERGGAGTPHPATTAAAATSSAATSAAQQNPHAHAAHAHAHPHAHPAAHHMYPPGYPSYLNYR
jgi:hypothetical protein